MPNNTQAHARNPSNPYAEAVDALDKCELIEILHGLLSLAQVMGGLDGAFYRSPNTLAVFQYVLFEGGGGADPHAAPDQNKFHYLQDWDNFYFIGPQYDAVITLFNFEGFEEQLELSCFWALKDVVDLQEFASMPCVTSDAQRLLQENTAHNRSSVLGRPYSEERAALKATVEPPEACGPEHDSDTLVRFNPFVSVAEYVPNDEVYLPARNALQADIQPRWRKDLLLSDMDIDIDKNVQVLLREDGVFVRSDAVPHDAPMPGAAEVFDTDVPGDSGTQDKAQAGPEAMATGPFEEPEQLLTATVVVACLVALQNLHAQEHPGVMVVPGEGR